MLDYLPTIAEIAIVITGFAGLVLALRPNDLTGNNINSIRLRMLAIQTMMLVVLCFLPGYLEELSNLVAIDQWTWANLLMALWFILLTFWRATRHIGANKNKYGSAPTSLKVVSGAYIIQVLACILVALGTITSGAVVVYLSGIMLNLLTSCLNFFILLFPPQEEA